MRNHLIRVGVSGAAFALCVGANASAQTSAQPVRVAQSTPAPQATPTPNAFTYSGYVRSYYFTRQNASSFTKTNASFNQASLNTGVSLHGAYNFGGNWSVGGSYLYADPFNGCSNPGDHVDASSPCFRSRKFTGPAGGTNPDDTLPGFRLSTLYEAYLQYKDPKLLVKLGDQVITTPWANASDSRIKPEAFRGGDASYAFDRGWTAELMYMSRFEDRASSNFTNTTLLTETTLPSTNYGGAAANILPSPFSAITTGGFGYGRIGYAGGPIAANLHYYAYQDIADALWIDAKYSLKGPIKPFVAFQAGAEKNAGSAVIGKIDSRVFGVQGGVSPWNNVDLTVSYDYIPQRTDTVTLPAGTVCGTNNQISGRLAYFLPAGGTTNCFNNADGTTNVYYGGWASPYTDSYATDPLFTTSISQGMADRRSSGSSVRVAGTFYMFSKRIKVIAGRAWYAYGNGTSGVSPTQETNVDATYYFSKLGKGAYHGFSLRHRYAERTQAYTSVFGGSPLFKYNRTQLEYDF